MLKMPKVTEVISSIFSRSKSQLETDAVPTNDTTPHSTTRTVDSTTSSLVRNLESFQSVDENNALAERLPEDIAETDFVNYNRSVSASAVSNNNVIVNNTQGQNVFQISHAKGVHIGSVFRFEGDRDQRNPEPTKPQQWKRTRTIEAMMQSNEPLAHRMLDIISTHLGEGWQDVMRQLDFSEGQIHQAKVDYSMDGGMKEVIYQLLLDWSRNLEDANLGRLTVLLWKLGHRETVHILKDAWKAEKMKNSTIPTLNKETDADKEKI